MENSSGSQRTCKWCRAPLSGRRSKAYCDDTCKQAAYYHRKKSAGNTRNKDVTTGQFHAITNHAPICVTDHNDNSITNHNNIIADAPQLRPEASFSNQSNNQSNNHFKMEHNQTTVDNYSAGKQSTEASSADEGAINVMGMGIDREFITGLLETMPEAQQRELSLMLMETVLERYPDLLGQLGGIPRRSNYSRTVTDETASEDERSETGEEEDIDEQVHEGYEKADADREDDAHESGDESSEEDKADADDDSSGSDYGEYGYGHDDDREAPENDEGEDESVAPNDDDDPRTARSSQPNFVMDREDDVPVFRLGGGINKANADTPSHPHGYDTANKAHERASFKASRSRQATATERPERDPLLRQQQDKRHESSGSYLNRFFDSSRIKRGMNIWEELAVTVPVFMEDYVMRYATDHLIGAQSAGKSTGRLVTLHILFHRSQHRRAVCRLLDLVVEAEEGILREEDFKPDGTPSTRQIANSDGEMEDDEDSEDDDTAGPVDYSCYGSDVANAYVPQHGEQYIQSQRVAANQSMGAMLQILGIGR